jgi:NTE family protein
MTTAFVLSGGGNLGAVQVGMLRALVERGERPDVIIGTSVGAVNGGWLASGSEVRDVDHLAAIWEGLSRDDIFPLSLFGGLVGFLGRRDHLVSNVSLRRLLEREVKFRRLEDAPIPLTVIAADVLTGREAAFSHGDAVETILASAAIPGVYPAVEIEGRPMIDGGVVNDTPVSHAVAAGADTIWALPTGFACSGERAPKGALGMVLHAIGIMSSQRLAMDIEKYGDHVDLRVVPPPCPLDISPTDFSRADELLEAGYSTAKAWFDMGTPPVRPDVTLQS